MLSAAVLVGCKDDGGDSTSPNGGDGNGSNNAKASYTQKAVLEYFSGAWCGYCPDGWLAAEAMMKTEANLFSVVYHVSDGMATQETEDLANLFSPAYPTGMINRIGGKPANRGTWNSALQQVMQESEAPIGLAIDATTDNGDGTFDVKVKVGVGDKDMPDGNYKLFVVAYDKSRVEPGDANFWQINFYYGTAGHPFEGVGEPIQTQSGNTVYVIKDYEHKNSVKDILTAVTGDKIDDADLTASSVSEYTFTVAAPFPVDVQNTGIIAFVWENTLATNSSFVYNAQHVYLGENQDFD